MPIQLRFVSAALCILMSPAILPAADAPKKDDKPKKPSFYEPNMAPSLSPQEALKAMTVTPGFKVSLFAGEPDIRQPKAFCIDDRGRLWVAEDYTYNGPGSGGVKPSGRDRIVIFEDADNDGKFDKRTIFFEGEQIANVSGIQVGFGGVWVGAAPNLLFFPDKDGDDKPDGPATILLDGFGRHDMHETLNTFLWGPDGWLYGTQGIFVKSKVGKPGTPANQRVEFDGAVFRYHPVTKAFEAFAHIGSNPWGLDWDANGQILMYQCVIPRMWHVSQGGYYQRQPGNLFSPYNYDEIKTIASVFSKETDGRQPGGQAFGGTVIYQGDSFPDKYIGKLFTLNLHKYSMYVEEVERRGSGFTGQYTEEILLANDRLFLGFALAYGPDGSIFFIDWYDRQTCHGQAADGKDTGRIYKLSYGDAKPATADLAKMNNADLVRLHFHKNEWFVRHARRLLQERPADPEAQAALLAIYRDNPEVSRKLRAFWTLQVTGGLNEAALLEATAHASEHIRGWAVQFLAESKDPSAAALKRFAEMARSDPSPTVRLYLASALQRTPLEKRWEILRGLLSHGGDVWDQNLPLMYWYAAEPLVMANQTEALKLAKESKIPKVREFIIRRVAAK